MQEAHKWLRWNEKWKTFLNSVRCLWNNCSSIDEKFPKILAVLCSFGQVSIYKRKFGAKTTLTRDNSKPSSVPIYILHPTLHCYDNCNAPDFGVIISLPTGQKTMHKYHPTAHSISLIKRVACGVWGGLLANDCPCCPNEYVCEIRKLNSIQD